VADFDPNLPTSGMDTSIYQNSATDNWAFLSRVPTPPPNHEEREDYAVSNDNYQQDLHSHPDNILAAQNDVLTLPGLPIHESNKVMDSLFCDILWADPLEDVEQSTTQQDFFAHNHLRRSLFESPAPAALSWEYLGACGETRLQDELSLTRPRLLV
jgi:hypothetical protein